MLSFYYRVVMKMFFASSEKIAGGIYEQDD